MPNAKAPNAPCVAVWLSPQTMAHARLREAQLGTDHVDDALLGRCRGRRAWMPNSSQLRAASRAALGHAASATGQAVVRRSGRCGPSWRRSGPAGARAAARAQALERLRRGHLVDEVQVDVEQRRPVRSWRDDVARPTSCRRACAAVMRSADALPAATPAGAGVGAICSGVTRGPAAILVLSRLSAWTYAFAAATRMSVSAP